MPAEKGAGCGQWICDCLSIVFCCCERPTRQEKGYVKKMTIPE
jgi:hypothetical protein